MESNLSCVTLAFQPNRHVTVAEEELLINRVERIDTQKFWLGWVDLSRKALAPDMLVKPVKLNGRAARGEWTVKRTCQERYYMPDRTLVLFDLYTGELAHRKWLIKNIRVPLAQVA